MNLFELFVKIGVDDQASQKLADISGKLGNGLKTAAKIGMAAVGTAAAGITALTTAAVNNYAEYEQLVGGVETLFKQSADTVMGYAENAYKTAGLSANEYMNTVTSFSASLLQSLGGDTEAAAKYADMAITDMSDNANKMGTSMEMIQNAYQGFSKQNYTMLDNLKLGYGGTKEEMQRLLDKANELNAQQGIITDYQIDSYADIVDAIHVVQTEMGITGTTAKEAGTTIQGAVASMKSAWTNLLTGLSDGNANIEQLVDNLVTTIVGDGTETNLGVLGNILPAIQTALNGASTLISEALPEIVGIIPTIINDNLPILAEAAVGIIQSLMDGISQNKEMLFDTIFGVVTYLAETFIEMLPQIVELGLDLIVSLANGISENLPEIIPTIVEIIKQIMATITENLPLLISSALEIIVSLANGIAENLPELIPTIIDVILQIVDTLTEPDNLVALVEASLAIIVALAEGLILSLPKLLEKAPEIITNLVMAINGAVDALLSAAAEIISTLARGIADGFNKILEKGRELVEKVKQGIKEKISSLLSIGKDIVNGVKNGIANAWDSFTSWVTSKFTGLVNSVKRSLGIASPSKVFASIGGFMAEGLGEGWSNVYSKIKEQIVGDMDFRPATVDFASSGVGRYTSILQSAFGDLVASINQDATIVVQSILDGRIIGETAYKYNLQTRRAYGV